MTAEKRPCIFCYNLEMNQRKRATIVKVEIKFSYKGDSIDKATMHRNGLLRRLWRTSLQEEEECTCKLFLFVKLKQASELSEKNVKK